MFAKAYEIASKFTYPLIISSRHYDDSVTCNIGAFVILNPDGWIITAAHVLDSHFQFLENKIEISNYENEVALISKNEKLTRKQQTKKISRIKKNEKWIINHSFWWGADIYKIDKFIIFQKADIAIAKIDGYRPPNDIKYPIFKNPNEMKVGTSLCKLGFPFHAANASFDKEKNMFIFEKETLPIPRFPIEGIHTRNIFAEKSDDDKYEVKFLEISTPGLRGQSGGPIFDKDGYVWGIQSRTHHYPLGFNPKIIRQGKEIEENQFLNVGLGIHGELIIKFLVDNGVQISITDEDEGEEEIK